MQRVPEQGSRSALSCWVQTPAPAGEVLVLRWQAALEGQAVPNPPIFVEGPRAPRRGAGCTRDGSEPRPLEGEKERSCPGNGDEEQHESD